MLQQHGPTAAGWSLAALGTQQGQHPTAGLHALKQVGGEANAESSTNPHKATVIYTRATQDKTIQRL